MNLDSLKTSSHIEEIMDHPNPMIMEVVKLYLGKQQMLNSATLGLDFLNIYLEIEAQICAYLERVRKEDTEMLQRILNGEDFEVEQFEEDSESPKFKF